MIDITPAEFSAVARRQVEAGVVASEDEAVVPALKNYAARFNDSKAAIEEGLADEQHQRVSDGRQVMADLVKRTHDAVPE